MSRRRPARRERTIRLLVARDGFVPADDVSEDMIREYRIGSEVDAFIYQPVDGRLWGRYWKILGVIAKGIGVPSDQLHVRVKISLKMFEGIETFGGEHMIVTKSITELDGPEFRDFYRRAMEFLLSEIVPGMTEEELLGPDWRTA